MAQINAEKFYVNQRVLAGRKFVMLLSTSETGNLAPIAVVMLPEALDFEAKPQHLNG